MSLTAVAVGIMLANAPLGASAADSLHAETPDHAVLAQVSQAASPPSPSVLTSADAIATTAPAPSPVLPTTASADAATPPPASPTEAVEPVQPIATDTADASAQSPVDDEQSEIVVSGSFESTPGDPLEQFNAESFEILQSIDGAVVEPVAKAYNKGLPKPVRQGLRNFFSNLDEPFVFAAYVLQLKPHSAVRTAARFAINSTLGLAGVVDVAKRKPFNLPYKPNGLANTLGYYGVGPGPYFYLPIVGPTTLRDLVGDSVEIFVRPIAIGGPLLDPAVSTTTTVLDQLGERAAFDETINQIHKQDDPYGTYRDLYLKQRQAEIDALHGRVTTDVVPVYGPGMRTAGGKDKEKKVDAQPEVKPQTNEQIVPAPEPATQELETTDGCCQAPANP